MTKKADLDNLTVAQLKEVATTEKVAITGIKLKSDIIAAINAARKVAAKAVKKTTAPRSFPEY